MPFIDGDIKIFGKVAYVEQEPSIFAGTIKENILFGKSFDPELYSQVIEATSLVRDFVELPGKDLTETGERGVKLSGGQRARVSLARALYSNADIYLLDDPLSAVDSKVSKDIFNNSIKSFLKNKTVVLVTHQIHFTEEVDQIVLLDKGSIVHVGKYPEFRNLFDQYFAPNQKSASGDTETIAFKKEEPKEHPKQVNGQVEKPKSVPALDNQKTNERDQVKKPKKN